LTIQFCTKMVQDPEVFPTKDLEFDKRPESKNADKMPTTRREVAMLPRSYYIREVTICQEKCRRIS
jgi:hypothetical protein